MGNGETNVATNRGEVNRGGISSTERELARGYMRQRFERNPKDNAVKRLTKEDVNKIEEQCWNEANGDFMRYRIAVLDAIASRTC